MLFRSLDQLPPVGGMIVVGFPKLRGGTGFPTRCFAVYPVEEG